MVITNTSTNNNAHENWDVQLTAKPESGLLVRVFSSKNALALAVADRICALAEERRKNARPLVLGLAAGASPRGVYHALELRVRTGRLDLSRCEAFCLDEYYPIDPEDPGSYFVQMSEVAANLGIQQEKLHIPLGDIPRKRIARHSEQYEAEIRSAGGIDFQILGVGRSGHIGFNEPDTARESRTRLVQLDDRTRRDAAPAFGGLDRVPKEAITMGIGTILDAGEIALIAMGTHKAAIVRKIIEAPPTSEVPASFLQTHGCVTAYLDEQAAHLLSGQLLG